MSSTSGTPNHDHDVDGLESQKTAVNNSNTNTNNPFEPGAEAERSDEKVPPQPAAGPPPGMAPTDFPDGGLQAWLVTLGAWCCLFASFGWVSSIGVFQTYYETNQLSNYSPSVISWIPSVEVFMLQVLAPLYGKVFDGYGARFLLLFGTFLHVFGLMMLSISHSYYQLFLAQSICSGLGASALFYAGTNSVSTWFFKRRALALGIVASGSSMGGLLIPIMFNELVGRIGFGWTVRAIAFMLLGLLIIANFTCRSRLNHTPKPFKVLEFVRPLKEPRFLYVALGSFFFFWGIFLPTNYIILYAQAHGMSASLAGYQLAILNAVSVFGRILPGWAGDRFGRFNVMIITNIFSVIIVLGLWIPSHSNAPIIVFSALYGLTSGAFVSLIPALVAQISDIRQIGVRVGTTFFIISFAALTGNPIGGALISRHDGDYTYLQVFCGVTMFVGSLFFFAARSAQVGLKAKKI